MGGGGGVYFGITLSVILCLCLIVSARYLLNHSAIFYQTWYCGVLSSGDVMQKNWFTVFIVKVTARAYLIKIWLFLLYLLNCWSICYQTWFDSTASLAGVSILWRKYITAFKVRVTVKVQNASECVSDDISWIKEHIVTNFCMLMQHYELECHTEKKMVHCLQHQGHSVGLYNRNMTSSTVSSKMLVHLQANLVW